MLRIDPVRISQVIRNLIDNAVKFTEKGEIAITLKEEEDKCVIAVKDTGMGIEKEKCKDRDPN